MKIVSILCTGGTFDKIYGSGAGVRNFSFPEVSVVADIMARLGIRGIENCPTKLYEMKDSMDMTDDDRKRIADWCGNNFDPCNCRVVIHGTDTMIDSARTVAERGLSRVIVFTGALQPACMRDTDAEFNLGGAIIAAQVCIPGVYIVMSGRIYSWDKCKKNPTTGHFEPL